jgi:hypothetical protein
MKTLQDLKNLIEDIEKEILIIKQVLENSSFIISIAFKNKGECL